MIGGMGMLGSGDYVDLVVAGIVTWRKRFGFRAWLSVAAVIDVCRFWFVAAAWAGCGLGFWGELSSNDKGNDA